MAVLSSGHEPEDPVEIAEGVYWVGFYDPCSGLHCNPYLIVDHGEAVVIDGGSRPDFAAVMMKIFRTGIEPKQIQALIYQHYDPDLCGSIANFEDIIDRKDLKVVSAHENLGFISHYSASSSMTPIEDEGHRYTFSSGRVLEFVKTPFCHSAGSFVTFDKQTGVLFSSDLFGSFGKGWSLFFKLDPVCMDCSDFLDCPRKLPDCPVNDLLEFHRRVMPTKKALRYALEKILEIPFKLIAPQHGSIIADRSIMRRLFQCLTAMENVGIDALVEDGRAFDFDKLTDRFESDED